MPPPPWRVKNTVNNLKRDEAKNEAMQKFTRIAADFGLPAGLFQRAGGWLLGCAKCTATSDITALYEQGKITKEQHGEFFRAVATAVDTGDRETLAALKGKLEALRRSR